MRKYELVPELKMGLPDGKQVYRIRALKNFADVQIGDIGGYVESEGNLSQENDCWVYDDAIVKDKARVEGKVCIKDHAIVEGNSCVCGKAKIHHHALVKGNTLVFGMAEIFDHAVIDLSNDNGVSKNAKIFGNTHISGEFVFIQGNAMIYGDTNLQLDHICIDGNATVLNEKYVFKPASLPEDWDWSFVTFYCSDFNTIAAYSHENWWYIDYFPCLFANELGLYQITMDEDNADYILDAVEESKKKIDVTNVPRPLGVSQNTEN